MDMKTVANVWMEEAKAIGLYLGNIFYPLPVLKIITSRT
jgi:hypothetical protein